MGAPHKRQVFPSYITLFVPFFDGIILSFHSLVDLHSLSCFFSLPDTSCGSHPPGCTSRACLSHAGAYCSHEAALLLRPTAVATMLTVEHFLWIGKLRRSPVADFPPRRAASANGSLQGDEQAPAACFPAWHSKAHHGPHLSVLAPGEK